MGRPIVYCCHCQVQLREHEFEAGKALHLENRDCCLKCAPELMKTLPPGETRAFLAKLARKDPTATPSRGTYVAPLTDSAVSRIQEGRRRAGLIFVCSGILLLGAVIAGVILFGQDGPPADERKPAAPVKTAAPKAAAAPSVPKDAVPGPVPVKSSDPPPPPPVPVKEREAEQALKKSREYQKAHPGDFARQIELAQEAVWTATGTTFFEEARKELDLCRRRETDSFEAELTALDRATEESIRKEAFGSAMEALKAAKSRRPSTAWGLAIGKRIREVNGAAFKLYDLLKEEALEARRRGDEAQVKAILDRLSKWGFSEMVRELEKTLQGR